MRIVQHALQRQQEAQLPVGPAQAQYHAHHSEEVMITHIVLKAATLVAGAEMVISVHDAGAKHVRTNSHGYAYGLRL